MGGNRIVLNVRSESVAAIGTWRLLTRGSSTCILYFKSKTIVGWMMNDIPLNERFTSLGRFPGPPTRDTHDPHIVGINTGISPLTIERLSTVAHALQSVDSVSSTLTF